IVLNSSRLIPALRSRYCGMVLYLSNSACQADASSGGTTPVTGFHSTIDRPDSVSRVAPPTTTVTNIRAATASSHSLMARRRVSEHAARLVMRSFGCRRRCGPYNQAPASANERDDAHPSPQARRRDHADRPGARLGALRDGARAIGCRQGQRHDRGALLRGRRPRLGVAGDAAHSLDVAARLHIAVGTDPSAVIAGLAPQVGPARLAAFYIAELAPSIGSTSAPRWPHREHTIARADRSGFRCVARRQQRSDSSATRALHRNTHGASPYGH